MSYAATMTQKGQITIPVAIRNYLGSCFKPAYLSIEKKRIIAQPFNNDILSLYGSLKPKNKKISSSEKNPLNYEKKITTDIAREGL